MLDLETKFHSLIRQGYVSKSRDDTKPHPISQISYLGKTVSAYELSPYGLFAVAPTNSMAIALSVNGQEENKAFFAVAFENRFKGLKEGEVLVGNTKTGEYVKFLDGGGIEIKGAVSITGDVSINGNANITGDLDVDGGITGATVGNGIIDLALHSHSVSTAPGTTGPAQ